MSYKMEVIADSSEKWASNNVTLATEQEAKDYAQDLASRWILVRETRVVPSNEKVNFKFESGKLVMLENV